MSARFNVCKSSVTGDPCRGQRRKLCPYDGLQWWLLYYCPLTNGKRWPPQFFQDLSGGRTVEQVSASFRLRWQHGTRSCSPGGEAKVLSCGVLSERQGPHMTLNLICNGIMGQNWRGAHLDVQCSAVFDMFDDLFVETCCCRFFVSNHNSLR